MLVKPSIRHTRRLLRPDHQIDIPTLLSGLTTSGDAANIFVTPFVCCTSAAFFHLNVLTSHSASYLEVSAVYVEAISTFLKNMYSFFIECAVPVRSPTVFAQKLRHVDTIIQRGL